MAAVLEAQDTAAKLGSQVDEQLAQATSRIRTHDIIFGGLVLLAIVLIYTTAMIVLDKYFNLPEAVRQAALCGLFVALAGTTYFTIIRPLRRKINPLYAAKQVERTIEDAKNSVTGYVDAQQKGNLNATVKAALANRAAQSVAEADVNKAVDHRSLGYLGGVAIACFIALVVLFFVFRPTQFASLMGRTFVPFSSSKIASRTQITLLKPEPAEPTITVGQSITVAVHVGGKVPNPNNADRMRLMIRHNPADPNYTELPMVQGDTSRDWELRVPDYLVQNGFWYKVVGGDDETPEYKVSIRSLPLFTDFQATYEYPKYLRRKNDSANDHLIRAYRGTNVTLVAKTNRDVRDGTMTIEANNTRVNGTLIPGKPDSVQFVFKLTESSKYKLTFTATNGERSADTFQSTIIVESDQAPTLVINKPEEDEITVPANGQLAIDGRAGDDFGVDTVTLKMKIVGASERPLPDKPFLNGKVASFRRAKDDTWPTDVEYKDSVDFAQLKKDAAGLALELTPDTVIEYWLEATDNCTEPKANVGRSTAKRVRLTAPKMEPEEKKNLDAQKEERKNEENKHNQQQQQKLEQENRDQPKNGQEQPKNGEQGEPKKDNNPGEPKKDNNPGEPKKDNNPGGMNMGGGMSDPKMPNDPKMPPDPNMNPNEQMNPKNPDNMGMGMGMDNKGQPNKQPDPKDIEKKADDLNKQIDQDNQNGGAAKPNAEQKPEDRANPGQQKQPPMGMGGMDNKPDASERKPDAKPEGMNPMNPMGKPENPPANSKPEGNVEKPSDPAASKPNDPKQPNPMNNNGQKGTAPSEQRDEPFGAPPGTEKPQPKEQQPEAKDPNAKRDPNSGATGKPDTKNENKPGNPEQKQDPANEAGSRAKPTPEQNRGDDKPNQPKGAPPADTKPEQKPDAGDAKPEQAPQAGNAKPQPKDDMMGMGANKPENKPDMKPDGTGAAEAKPDDKKNPPMAGGDKAVDKGMDKPQPKDDPKQPNGNGNANNTAPQPKQKLDEKQQKELEEAANNLTNPDEKKRQEARDKLDRAIGKEKREELEKIANDLKSPDEKTRDAAKQKLEEMKKQAQGGKEPDKKDNPPKIDEKQQKEIADALKDLQNGDEKQKQQAREKLDKMVGENNRKEAEQLMEDLKSPDKDKQAAAQKKLDDLRKQLDQQAKKDGDKKEGDKGRELTKEELAELAKKAQDLQSKDDMTRQKAEKELDDKIGKENREKLQEALKNQKPMTPEDEQKLKDQLEQMAKEQSKKDNEWKQPGGGSSPAAKGPMDEDLKNRLKTAELRLEEFEKKKYDEAFLKKQGYTPEEYEKFLKDYEKYVESLRNEAKSAANPEKAPMPGMPGDPARPITAGGGGKVDPKAGVSSGSVGGPTVAPPGFENVRDKFDKLINPKK